MAIALHVVVWGTNTGSDKYFSLLQVFFFFFFFFYLCRRRESRLSNISLRGCLYSNPCFSSPVYLQRRSKPDGVRDLWL
jgi:hypothetical protein